MYVRDMDSTDSLWPQRGHRFAAGMVGSNSRLFHMINAFEHALRGAQPAETRDVRSRIRAARTPLDLWDLRLDVHELVRRRFDRWEARMRLDDLDSLFDAPRPRGAGSTA
jgi:hypothetical protein